MPRIRNTTLIRRSPADVFDFVTTPMNWPRWHPASLAVNGTVAHSLRVSEHVIEHFMILGRRARVVWTVRVRRPPWRWRIVGNVEGGGSGVITYSLTPHAEGTWFVRDFVYRLPNAPVAVLDLLFLRGRLRAESAQAMCRLRELLDGHAS